MALDIPARPTMRDLYQLVATLSQQIANQGQELQAVREEVARQNAYQQDEIRIHTAEIRRLNADLARIRVEVEGLKAWQLGHAFTCPFTGMSARTAVRAQLQHLMHQAFSLEELNILAFKIGVTADDLRGETLAARVQELVLHCERRGMVNLLLEMCRHERPEMSWPLAYE